MSVQSTSGRHRASRLARYRAGLRRIVRAALKQTARVGRRVRPGSAYMAELLTPRQPSVLHLGHARIGYYPPSYVAAAPQVGDEVRIGYYPIAGWSGLPGIVSEIVHDWRPIVVEVPGVGTLTCSPGWLELVGRNAERTLTMEAITAGPQLERAW